MLIQQYIIRDAVNYREFREYVQKIIQAVKNVDMNFQNQLNFIYNDINVNVRTSIMRRLRKAMNFNELFIKFNEFKFNWWAKVKKLQRRSNQSQNQNNRVQFIIKEKSRYDQNEQSFDQYINCQYQRLYQNCNYYKQ